MPSNESFFVSDGKAGQSTWQFDAGTFGFTPKKLRVICVGAGYSGLSLAYKLKYERPMDFVDFTVYEKNPEVGGTWFTNVYPGVGCDIPAPSYVFPFEPNPDWSKFYVGGAEIQEYIVRTANKYGLKEKVVFNTRVVKSVWNEESGKWKLQLEQGGHTFDDEADVLINGSGCLSKWKWPDIEGLHSFKGKLLHSAQWDPDYDWEGKKVAVIGNGSSALQLVPALQPKAAKLVNYIRHPTWVAMNFCPNLTRDGLGTNFEYTEQEKQHFRENPKEFHAYRKEVEHAINSVFQMMLSGTEENKFLHGMVENLMRQRLSGNPELMEKLIPNYEVGCRRLSPGDGYLEALQAENARPAFENIKRITPTGIEADEGEEEFDLIACATGFNTNYVPPWEIIGRNGRRLDEEWNEKPEAYFATCAAGLPNYFVFSGPNFPIGHGSVPTMLYTQAEYMMMWIEKMATERIRSTVVKDSVVRDFNLYAKEGLKRFVWSKGCHAWYSKKTDGEDNIVTAMYPGSALHFKVYMDKVRGEHFDIQYDTNNTFGFLGNGELAMERTKEADMAFYM